MTIEQALLSTEALGTLRVESLRGLEAMNDLPSWQVTVLAETGDVALADLVGQDALLELGDEEGSTRQVPLMVREVAYAGATRTGYRYEFTLGASVSMLTERSGYRVLLGESARSIVARVLGEAGVKDESVLWRLDEPLVERHECVQYGETEWGFVERLLADEGVSYWFDADADGHALLVLGDSGESHDPIDGETAFGFSDAGGARGSISTFHVFERTARLVHDSVHVRDYDVRQPDVLIEAETGDGGLQHYEYPACVLTEKAAKRRAEVRLQQLQRASETAAGETHSVRLAPGRVVTLAGVEDEGFDGAYLVVAAEHELQQAGRHAEGRSYRCRVKLVPHAPDRAHRPALPRDVPRVDGLETALVVGPSGEEIHVDDLGRIKLALPWDPSGRTDDTASTWVRSMQLHMDGSMILPRMGMEMAVGYRDGRPDVPLALGRVYNGTSRPPYGLPGKKATASLMSGTTPGGGSVNEIRMSDDAGSQQFGVQASGDMGVSVGGNCTTTIGANETHSVKANLTEHIKGSQNLSVGANQTLTAGAAAETKVKGARVVAVGGNETIGVTKNRVLQCASYSESVAGLYSLRCNIAAETCHATYTGVVGGAMTVAAGCGLNETVLGARTEVVGGPRVVAATSMTDRTIGAKIISCGAHALSAKAVLATAVKGAATIQAASAKISGGGGVRIEAASVTIAAASLSVSGGTTYKIAGSHSASADVNLDNSKATYSAGTKAKG